MAKTDDELKKDIESVLKKSHPTSINELGRLMGYKKISGSLTKRIKTLLPKLPEFLEKNKAVKALDRPKKSAGKKDARKTTKKSRPSKIIPPRSPVNGYRENSNYGLCFDVLYQMGYKEPVNRRDLLGRYAELSGKDIKHAGYDLAVVLSPTESGKFHRSADSASKKFPHFVRRVGDGMVQLVVK